MRPTAESCRSDCGGTRAPRAPSVRGSGKGLRIRCAQRSELAGLMRILVPELGQSWGANDGNLVRLVRFENDCPSPSLLRARLGWTNSIPQSPEHEHSAVPPDCEQRAVR